MTSLFPNFSELKDEVSEEVIDGGSITDHASLSGSLFSSYKPIIGGITVTGGEPLLHYVHDQLNATTQRTRAVPQAQKGSDLSVVTYLIPPLVALALANNAAVLGIVLGSVPFRRAIFLSVRLLYVALAVADLLAVLLYQTINWLDGSLHLGIQTAGNASCRLTKWAAFTAEMSSQWLLVWLCLTRIASITWPLRLKAVTAPRVTAAAIIGAVLFAVATSSFTLWTFSVGKGVCTAFSAPGTEANSGLLRLALLGGTQYIVSTLVLLVLSFVLAGRLLDIARQRRTLLASSGASKASGLVQATLGEGGEDRNRKHEVGSRELRMAVTILMMAALHLCVHVIGAGLWAMLYLEAASGLSPRIRQALASVAGIVDSVSILIRLWNFYAYLATIPTFRAAVFFGITCGRCTTLALLLPKSVAQRPTTDSMVALGKQIDSSKSPEKSTVQL